MLSEVADADALRAKDVAIERREAPGEQLSERALAIAVLAEQRNAVVLVDIEIEPGQDRLAGRIANRGALYLE